MSSRALTIATLVGTVLQLAMVIAGHSNKSIAALFAVGGMGISLVAGLVYAMAAKGGSRSSLALGGLISGGVCALLGIIVSYLLGDVPALILFVGTASSAVTGFIGGLAGKLFVRRTIAAMLVASAVVLPRHTGAQSPRMVSPSTLSDARTCSTTTESQESSRSRTASSQFRRLSVRICIRLSTP